jgi:hypothetical protein
MNVRRDAPIVRGGPSPVNTVAVCRSQHTRRNGCLSTGEQSAGVLLVSCAHALYKKRLTTRTKWDMTGTDRLDVSMLTDAALHGMLVGKP